MRLQPLYSWVLVTVLSHGTDEFIEVNLELIAAHAVIGSDQPLLQVANRSVCQRNDRLGALPQIDSQGLVARHVLVTSLMQPAKLLRPSVYTMEPGSTFRFRKGDQS